jgi:MFS-type transporter involved in bile tolerance (Atg22 family)
MTQANLRSPVAVTSRLGKWFVLAAVFIDMVGIGIANPVLPILVGEYSTSNAEQTHWAVALSVVYGLMQFLCAPLFGAVSDRFGRRPVLLLAIAGLGVHYILIATAPSLWIMLFARILGGITGASFSVANAYIADISPPEERAKSLGLIALRLVSGSFAVRRSVACSAQSISICRSMLRPDCRFSTFSTASSSCRNRFRLNGAEDYRWPKPIRSAR